MPEVFGIDGRRGFGRETGQILADCHAADIGVGVEKGLERNWGRNFARADQLTANLEYFSVDRLEEMSGIEQFGDTTKRFVIYQSCA